MKTLIPILATTIVLTLLAGCGEDDSKPIEVVRVTPTPGTRIAHNERLTVRFNTPIIPSSGTIAFGHWTLTLPESEPSDTIRWTRCYSAFAGERVPFAIRDFQDADGTIQAEAFEASYSEVYIDLYSPTLDFKRSRRNYSLQAFYSAPNDDPDPPKIIAHHPSGSDVDPATTREIRIAFDSRITGTFTSVPLIHGVAHFGSDDIGCIGVVRWDIADTDQLRYGQDYLIVLNVTDAAGNKVEETITFTTKE